MKIKNIHLIRASQAKPFVETASRLGAPVKALALESALPLDVVLSGEGVIGEHSLWDFVALSSTYLECEHFGYLTALDHPVDRIGKLGGMTIARAKSLEAILQSFTRDVVNQSDNSDYQLFRKNGETWFIRGIPWQHKAGWIAEQYVLAFVIQIIRLCAPGDWLPQRVRIATRETPVSLPFEWCSISIDWGSRKSGLLIDDNILSLTPRYFNNGSMLSTQENSTDVMLIEDLIDRQIWSQQIGLEILAQELGKSSSTLKRRLSKLNTSYREILLGRRLHQARRLIDNSDLSIGRIAKILGYTAVSNFSRTFHSATGYYPTELRKLSTEARSLIKYNYSNLIGPQ